MPGIFQQIADQNKVAAQQQAAASAQQQQVAAQQQAVQPTQHPRMGLGEKFVTEFEDLVRQRPYKGYGVDFSEKVQKKRAAKKQPEAGALTFSLLPAAEPEVFSLDELYDLSTDAGFASKILESYTGKVPTEQQVSSLQSRVREKYPDLQENPVFESPKDVIKQMVHVMDIGSKTGNFKPYVDLIISHPGIAPEFLEEAKKIKDAGYKETPQNKQGFDALKAQIRAFTPQAKEALLSHIERTGSFSSGLSNLQYALNPSGFEANASPEAKSAKLQDEALKKSVEAAKASKTERAKATPLRMREARNIEEEVENLKESSRRIAPLNEVHEQAKQLLNQNLGQGSLEAARRDIATSQGMDISSEIAPYLRRAAESPQQFIQDYEVNYGPVIEGFRREAAKDFLEHDLPQINSQFASKGAFFSGAREAALNKARADKEARLEREISKLKVHGREEAMKHFHEHQGRHLKSAEIAGNAKRAQKEAQVRGAEALRENALTGKAAALQDVSALSNIARTQQEQAQHELDVRMAEHKEFQERPWVELARKSALAQGHPLPSFQFSPIGINPPAPNVYELGAGALGTAAGLHRAKYGSSQPYKKGGHVRTKHAQGDSIARHAAELKKMEKHYEGTPSANVNRESMREAQATRHHAIDPESTYLMTLGSHILANAGKGRAVQSFGEGSQKGFEAFNAAKIHNVESKHKYINLINAINQSRMDQQSLLSNYHLKRSQNEETQRYHNMANAESIRAHNMMNERHTEKPHKMSATEINLEEEAKQKLLKSAKMKQEVNYLRKLIKNTNTGPRWGFVKSHLPTTETDNEIRLLTNSIIMDMHQGMKNIPRSEAFLERLESTKPNIRNHYSSNKLSVDILNKGANDVNKNATSTLRSLGWTPERIQEFLKEEKENPEDTLPPDNPEPANDNEYTWMQFPGETKEIEVANDDVAKALERGAKIV